MREDTAGETIPKADFLGHSPQDDVAVAVHDVASGPRIVGWLSSSERRSIDILDDIPLGHKVALSDLDEGAAVIEYGVRVALARCPIRTGQLVHVHNVRSARWQYSA